MKPEQAAAVVRRPAGCSPGGRAQGTERGLTVAARTVPLGLALAVGLSSRIWAEHVPSFFES
jgi:hypothetical protein